MKNIFMAVCTALLLTISFHVSAAPGKGCCAKKAEAASCCKPGAECCKPGAACCGKGAVAKEDAKAHACCKPGAECCKPGAACEKHGAKTAQKDEAKAELPAVVKE